MSPSSSTPSGQGLPRETLLQILEGIREELQDIRDVVSETEVEMISASLLLVYEADWEQAKVGLEALDHLIQVEDSSNDQMDEEGEDSFEDDAEEGEDDGGEEEEEEELRKVPYDIRLIDFAHTRTAPGRGPDQRVLFGLDTTLKLLDGRIAEVRELG